MTKRRIAKGAAVAVGDFCAAGFPQSIDGLPRVAFPDTALVDEAITSRRSADMSVVADDAPAHRAIDAHSRSGHALDDAVFDQVVFSRQPDAGSLRKCRAVAKDQPADTNILHALRMLKWTHAEQQ